MLFAAMGGGSAPRLVKRIALGTGFNGAGRVTVDAAGNYVVVSRVVNSGDLLFIGKYAPDGTRIWAYTYNDYVFYPTVLTDSSNNIYVAGTSSTYNASFVMKISSAGSLQWAKYSGTFTGYPAEILGVDSSSNVYVTMGGGTSVRVIKLDSSGVVQWSTDPSGSPLANYLRGVADSSGNSYYATATSTIVKLDNTGAEVWQKVFSGAMTTIYSIRADPLGAIIVGGDTGVVKLSSAGASTGYYVTPHYVAEVVADAIGNVMTLHYSSGYYHAMFGPANTAVWATTPTAGSSTLPTALGSGEVAMACNTISSELYITAGNPFVEFAAGTYGGLTYTTRAVGSYTSTAITVAAGAVTVTTGASGSVSAASGTLTSVSPTETTYGM